MPEAYPNRIPQVFRKIRGSPALQDFMRILRWIGHYLVNTYMSRLRRIELHSRYFFVTCNIARNTPPFTGREFALLARSIVDIRKRLHFAVCGYCFMPDHWHAVLYPFETTSISDVLMRIKIASHHHIAILRPGSGAIWQHRFYDRVLRNRAEFEDAIGYMHRNPVRGGLVEREEDWPWSSARCAEGAGVIVLDDVRVPLDRAAKL